MFSKQFFLIGRICVNTSQYHSFIYLTDIIWHFKLSGHWGYGVELDTELLPSIFQIIKQNEQVHNLIHDSAQMAR